MKVIRAYECRCGQTHIDKKNIYTCKECGKEICTECSGFDEDLCWSCNDKYIEENERELVEYFNIAR